MKSEWKIGDMVRFDGRNGLVYGIIISKGSRDTRRFRVLWFDDEQSSDEDPTEDNNRVIKVSG